MAEEKPANNTKYDGWKPINEGYQPSSRPNQQNNGYQPPRQTQQTQQVAPPPKNVNAYAATYERYGDQFQF